MQKSPPDGKALAHSIRLPRWWLCGAAMLLVAFIATMALAVWQSYVEPFSIWRESWPWAWVHAPFFAWMAAVWVSHWRSLPSCIMMSGAVVSCIVVLAFYFVVTPKPTHGYYAMDSARLNFLIVPLLQWLLLIAFAALATIACLVQRNVHRGTDTSA